MATRDSPGNRSVARYVILILLLIGGLVVAGVIVYPSLTTSTANTVPGALMYRAARAPLQVTVTAEGNVESASNIDVKCRVAGGSTILWIVEDGKIVDEGDEIVRLDTSNLEDQLNSQRITYEKALATEIQAREDLEAAKIAVKEYEEGTFVEQLKLAEADIRIALENLRSAESQLEYSKRMARKGFVSSLQREADEFAVERAKLDLDAANLRKKVLVEFTKQKTLTDLVAKREAAAAKLRSERAALELEKDRLERMEEQLKHCIITAPKKGMVVYANEPSRHRFGGSQQDQIEEGAMVREGQALLRLPDLSQMQVKVTIHESRVDQIRPSMPANITIQDEDYRGSVLRIANQPERTSWFSANVKEYATTVSIDGESEKLRPGMTAKVVILVSSSTDALTVPVSAVVEQRGKFYCWVNTPQGPERRPLVLGSTNDKLIEIVDGVKEGEEVYRNPRAIVQEARKEPPFEKQLDDATFSIAGSGEADTPATGTSSPAGETGPRRQPPAEEGVQPGAGADALPAGGPPGDASKRRDPRSFDLMQFDTDGDGKLSQNELPERMQMMFDQLDGNSDGFIDSGEIAAMRRRFEEAGGGRRPAGAPGAGGPPSPGGAGRGRETPP